MGPQVAPPVWAEEDVNFYDESSNAHCKFTRKEICFTNCYIMQIIIPLGVKLKAT